MLPIPPRAMDLLEVVDEVDELIALMVFLMVVCKTIAFGASIPSCSSVLLMQSMLKPTFLKSYSCMTTG